MSREEVEHRLAPGVLVAERGPSPVTGSYRYCTQREKRRGERERETSEAVMCDMESEEVVHT